MTVGVDQFYIENWGTKLASEDGKLSAGEAGRLNFFRSIVTFSRG
jgi:hypothetical protein